MLCDVLDVQATDQVPQDKDVTRDAYKEAAVEVHSLYITTS